MVLPDRCDAMDDDNYDDDNYDIALTTIMMFFGIASALVLHWSSL